jgi:DNA-binding transcriptional ArsR family regulator
MAVPASSQPKNLRTLRFACSCASAFASPDDPWAAVAQDGKLNDGTKELLLNVIYRQPRTITQLAQLLGLSAPTIHRHITELLANELILETDVPEQDRESVVEHYYRPNFPVVLAADRREFQPVLEMIADEFSAAMRASQPALAEAFARTALSTRGESVESFLHYLYTAAVRIARNRLEAEGALPPWPEHADGSRWVWWAEEPLPPDAEHRGD